MRITRNQPPPTSPPPEFTMAFSRDEGWAIVHALLDYSHNYPSARDKEDYKQWARDLETELRRGL